MLQCNRVRGQDGFGIFALVVPRRLLKPNASVQLRVTGSASHSRRWFMLYAYDDTVERLRGE
ncbi:MAG TPA: hypothetical protein EYP10_04755 [Armatimonadetes bacterium]|nr:hypothetical protein [Armatimonadota bacterium]